MGKRFKKAQEMDDNKSKEQLELEMRAMEEGIEVEELIEKMQTPLEKAKNAVHKFFSKGDRLPHMLLQQGITWILMLWQYMGQNNLPRDAMIVITFLDGS